LIGAKGLTAFNLAWQGEDRFNSRSGTTELLFERHETD
jgi:hypothetical protein